MRLVAVAAVAGFAALLGNALSAEASPTVSLSGGPFNGATLTGITWPTAAGVNAFLGIEYASSPGGDLRWYPPQPPVPGSLSINATGFGSACPQTLGPGNTLPPIPTVLGTVPQSEECLFLNVFVPATATPSSKLPVLFWIHGGSLTSGTGAQYDPSQMVQNANIIVVTINYRLGALGWLALPALEPSQNGEVAAGNFMNPTDAGNYGLMDQQYALAWVHSYIAAFGGDPTKVTMAGESAGGVSVLANVTSTNTATGLFRAVIAESGAYVLDTMPSEATYEAGLGAGFLSALSPCGSAGSAAAVFGCLQSAPLVAVLQAQSAVFGAFGISPDSGTKVLPNALQSALSGGHFIRVPVLHGSNASEGRLFEPGLVPFAASAPTVIAAGGPATYDLTHSNAYCGGTNCTYPQEIGLFLETFGLPSTNSVDTLLSREYPLTSFRDPYTNNAPNADEALAQIFTDAGFACSAFEADLDLLRYVPVYAYEFTDPQAPPTPLVGGTPVVLPNDVAGFPTAAEHGAEISFLFSTGVTLSAGEQTLSSEMQRYWTNFVKNLNPSVGASVPSWSRFSILGNMQQLVPGPSRPYGFSTFSLEHFCSTWQTILNAEATAPPS